MMKEACNYIATELPEWYLGWTIEGNSEYDVSAAIVRLGKFGVLKNTSFLYSFTFN